MDPRTALQSALGGAYRVERELSEGTGRAFLATEIATARAVVVKVLPRDFAVALTPAQFSAALEPLRQLHHPHVVRLLSIGQAEGRLRYYLAEYVDGEPLRALLVRAGKLPISDVVTVVRDVARALAYGQAQGVVHGDLTPATILLRGSTALVSDLGVARALGFTGMPAYTAPEGAGDHRADLYALGVIAYELLTEVPPFIGRSPAQLAAAHASDVPAPVAARRPATPPALAGIVMKLLAKQPEERYQSAVELLRAIDVVRVTPAERVASAPPPPALPRRSGATTPSAVPEPADRSLRRKVALVGAILAVIAAAVLVMTCPRHANVGADIRPHESR